MPPNRRKVTVTAPPAAWKRLGELLTDRRKDLGYTYRVPFDKVSNVNQRMQADIEMAAKDRINHFTDGTLRKIARGYQVSLPSMLAVLRGEADELAPALPAAPRRTLPPAPLPAAPMDDPARESADRPYFAGVLERFVRLVAEGARDPSGTSPDGKSVDLAAMPFAGQWDPSGEQLGLSPVDAKIWDGSAGAMSQSDRAWLVADMQRRRDDRNANGQSAASA